jgi:hypothetical protein
MGVLLDKAVNLSSIYGASYATFNPAVTSGLQVFSLLGQTLPLSLLNSAPGGVNSTVGSGLPVVSSPSGIQVGTSALGRLNTSYTDVGGSMTVMVVAQTPYTAEGSFASSETNNANQLFSLRFSPTAYIGCTLNVSYNNSAGPTSLLIQGASAQSSPLTAQMQLPNFFIGKVDLTNNLASLACFTAPTIVTGGTLHFAGSAPFTRPPTGNPVCVGTASGVELGGASTVHAIAIFNRVTTASEDALMYGQIQALMASRSITI